MISVIVPVYKVEPYLPHCLDSILAQTYRVLEIILIDDGSPDRCGEICDEYAKLDSRIKVFHTENGGLSVARNIGLREAKGEYIGFVDSDDWIEHDMYELLLQRIEDTDADISACDFFYEYIGNKRAGDNIQDAFYEGLDAIRALVFSRTYNVVWNKLYKKKCWEDISFPENQIYEDLATTYKLIKKCTSIVCTPHVLYHYRIRKSSISHTFSMKGFIDYWHTEYIKYLELKNLLDKNSDQKYIKKMEETLAISATKIWRTIYSIPMEQRDYRFLQKISCFSRKHFPPFSYNNRGWLFCSNLFLTRYANDFTFAITYALSRCYSFFKKTIMTSERFYQ